MKQYFSSQYNKKQDNGNSNQQSDQTQCCW